MAFLARSIAFRDYFVARYSGQHPICIFYLIDERASGNMENLFMYIYRVLNVLRLR